MKAIRVLIADDHEIARVGIKCILRQRAIYEICRETSDGRAAVEETCRLKPDLAILDIGLPLLNGMEAARQIMSRSASTSVLIFTEVDSDRSMLDALRIGVRGFVSKTDSAEDLLAGIDAVLAGRTFFSSRMTHMFLNFAKKHSYRDLLSPREREIVQLVAEGHTTRKVARMLTMSIKTVETHRSNLMRKLEIHSTAQLILYAVRNQIIHIDKPMLEISPNNAQEKRLSTPCLEVSEQAAAA
jgi:DNA-binding NarL/FixJ family response regulator